MDQVWLHSPSPNLLLRHRFLPAGIICILPVSTDKFWISVCWDGWQNKQENSFPDNIWKLWLSAYFDCKNGLEKCTLRNVFKWLSLCRGITRNQGEVKIFSFGISHFWVAALNIQTSKKSIYYENIFILCPLVTPFHFFPYIFPSHISPMSSALAGSESTNLFDVLCLQNSGLEGKKSI